jgi:hypothetical protein
VRALAAVALAALAVAPAAASDLRAPSVTDLSVTNGGAPYAGDRPAFATITPNGDGYRDRAVIRFRLNESATVTVVVAAIDYRARKVFDRTLRLSRGLHVVEWRPRSWLPPRTYGVRVTARDRHGNVRRYGYARPLRTPVIRVLGIDAAFARESYPPSSAAELALETDETALTLQLFRVGDERIATHANDPMSGAAVMEPQRLVRSDRRNRPRRLRVWVGDWPSGLYIAQLTGSDGRSGYAPFVVRPRRLGEHRVAVVLPTYTWQAYNFRDGNGDGFGDTWYAGETNRTLLGRAYLDRGVPPFFRRYDLNFLLWRAREIRAGKDRGADFLADSDLAGVRDAAALARAYDLLVFPGHHEYVTRREYRLVRGFRNRGGNLMFLSANNFFWRVDRRGRTLTRVAEWRDLGRPEAELLGVQYLASDRGGRRAPFVVRAGGRARWLFEGTGLETGSTFGSFGIEIDHRTARSPRRTIVLAEISNLFGRGKTAQMTYYETRSSAKVFAAGAFTLSGYALYQPVSTMLDNLWARLARP